MAQSPKQNEGSALVLEDKHLPIHLQTFSLTYMYVNTQKYAWKQRWQTDNSADILGGEGEGGDNWDKRWSGYFSLGSSKRIFQKKNGNDLIV